MKNIFLACCVLASLAACQSAGQYASQYPSFDKVHGAGGQNRVVLYNAAITLRLKEPDSLNKKLPALAKKYDGYVVTLGDNLSTVRVAATQLNKALQELSTMGKVTSRTVSGQDVTDEYTDYTIRLDNAEKARQRYLQLLALAENVETTVKVEKELERLNSEIDLLKGKINRIDHLAAFSTININLEKKHKTGILGYPLVWAYKGVKWLFVRD